MTSEDSETKMDDELREWRAAWQHVAETPRDFDARSILMRQTQRLRWQLGRELLGAGGTTAFYGWLLVRFRGELSIVVLCTVLLVFTGVWVGWQVTTLWRRVTSVASGTDNYVRNARAELLREIAMLRAGRRISLIASALAGPWCVWWIGSHWDAYVREPWRGIVGVGVAVAITLAAYVWSRARERRIEHERTLLADALYAPELG
jgi:hypothetical protein